MYADEDIVNFKLTANADQTFLCFLAQVQSFFGDDSGDAC